MSWRSWLSGLTVSRQLRIEQQRFRAAQLKYARQNLERLYEAAQPSQYYHRPGSGASANAVMSAAGTTLRSYARHLDENHDLAVGILDDLVRKTIGRGIHHEPMVRGRGGDLATDLNEELTNLHKEWTYSRPDASRTLPWPLVENLVARTWLRDGEILVQHLEGAAPIRHRSRVPYSIELIEPDYLPFDLNRESRVGQNRIVHGVELTDWREPVGYWVYKEHPGDLGLASSPGLSVLMNDYKRVSADVVSHLKFVRRVAQVRGVSVFHAVLRRLDDIKEYEESERVAARVAAAMCAAITRSSDFAGPTTNDAANRTMEFNPGMIFDGLLPGERVETIGTSRPNQQLEEFRNSQLRAVASGTGSSYSATSRNYNGTYSAQRQELVESWVGYDVLREYLYGAFYQPIWERFVRMAMLAGLINFRGADPLTIFNCDFVGPTMPWIDPLKEVQAKVHAIDAKLKSRHQVIRENQDDPQVVDQQIENDPFRQEAPPMGEPDDEAVDDDDNVDDEADDASSDDDDEAAA